MIKGNTPVKWFYIDNWCFPQENWKVPDKTNSLWVNYNNDCEYEKRTTTNLIDWNLDLYKKLNSIELINICSMYFNSKLEVDPTLHGAGLHVMSPSGYLSCHLDYDRHPKLKTKRRAVNLLVFCHSEWKSNWGGELYLTDPLGNKIVEFLPVPGRLVAFETNDLSYHGVNIINGPKDRMSIASYLLEEAYINNTRQRAMFLPNRI